MSYTTIRISRDTSRLIKELSEKSDLAQQEILNKAIRVLREQMFWEECEKAYKQHASNPEEVELERQETELYENTLLDGISDD